MKPIVYLSTTIACLLSVMAGAQDYHPFPTSGAIWNSTGHNVFTNAGCEFRFGVYGDTVINSMTWTKVYALSDTTLISPTAEYFGAIREDENRRVWFTKPDMGESILYDFSAEAGDTIFYQWGGALCGDTFAFWPQTPHYLRVTGIDSLLLENGEYRKQWHLEGNFLNDTWVEGIGSIKMFALFNPILSDLTLCGDSYDFACFRQDYLTLFLSNENCQTCYCDIILSWTPLFIDQGKALSVYPNPARSELTIRIQQEQGPWNIRLFDMTGKIALDFSDLTGNPVTIPVSSLSSGSYLLVIRDSGGKMVSEGKLVVR